MFLSSSRYVSSASATAGVSLAVPNVGKRVEHNYGSEG